MDRNNKAFTYRNNAENVNGVKTVDGFNTYNKIRNPKNAFDIKLFILYFTVFLLLLASVFIFISSIYTAYADKDSKSADSTTSITKVKAGYQTNDTLKVQPIDNTIAEIYEIPVGIKIIEIDYTDPLLNGLRVGDIVVEAGGKKVYTIYDLYPEIAGSHEEHLISYTVFRNGVYRTVIPFEE